MNILDQLNYFNSLSDQSHRFWAYFQVVSLALLGWVWSEYWIASHIYFIMLGYIVFAAFNMCLLYTKQQELIFVWQIIKNTESTVDTERAFIDSKKQNKPWSAKFVGIMQIAISLGVLACICSSNSIKSKDSTEISKTSTQFSLTQNDKAPLI